MNDLYSKEMVLRGLLGTCIQEANAQLATLQEQLRQLQERIDEEDHDRGAMLDEYSRLLTEDHTLLPELRFHVEPGVIFYTYTLTGPAGVVVISTDFMQGYETMRGATWHTAVQHNLPHGVEACEFVTGPCLGQGVEVDEDALQVALKTNDDDVTKLAMTREYYRIVGAILDAEEE